MARKENENEINYGIHELHKIHEEIRGIVNNTDPLTIEWIACSTFLAEVYELEVTKHGGLDAEKIKEYKAVYPERGARIFFFSSVTTCNLRITLGILHPSLQKFSSYPFGFSRTPGDRPMPNEVN